jgi:hypothetical protein
MDEDSNLKMDVKRISRKLGRSIVDDKIDHKAVN